MQANTIKQQDLRTRIACGKNLISTFQILIDNQHMKIIKTSFVAKYQDLIWSGIKILFKFQNTQK